jgi:glycosyltransferase involved in cell wall biosynthesis
MKVVVDARPAIGPRPTGVGRYAREILRHLPAADPDAAYVAWYLHAKGLLRPRSFFPGAAPNLAERASRFPARVYQPLAWRTGFPRIEWLVGDYDLFLATNFLPPATGRLRRVVPVVHDLAFVRYPGTAPHVDERWRRRLLAAVLAAPGVIVPSNAVRDDLILFAPSIDPTRVHVVHHGVEQATFTAAPAPVIDDVRRRFAIGRRYALSIGGIEPRKNLTALVRAFGLVADPDVWLVIAGGAVNWFPEASAQVDAAVEALPLEVRARVVRTGYVSDPDRVALLSGAEVLAYPSLAEGFGFPVLEAFAANVPVLTSNTSSLPEVAGDAAVLVDPTDPGSIAAGLDELFSDSDLRAMLRAKGLARVTGFTWERCARATAKALHEAAEHAR